MGRRKGDRTRGKYVANPKTWNCEYVELEHELYDDDRYEYFKDKLKMPDEDKVAGWVREVYEGHCNNGLRWLAQMTKTDASRLCRWFHGECSLQYKEVLRLIMFVNSLSDEYHEKREVPTSEEEILEILHHMYRHEFRYVNPSYVTWRHDWSEDKYWKWYNGEAERGLTYRKMKGYLDTVLFEFECCKYVFDTGKRCDLMIIC